MPTSIKGQRMLWVRLCALASFLILLSMSEQAFAAVPMCGVHAQTVAAPPIGTPTDSAVLKGDAPCNSVAPLRVGTAPDREPPQPLSLPELPIRALPLNAVCAPPQAVRRLGYDPNKLVIPPAFTGQSIYRPPR